MNEEDNPDVNKKEAETETPEEAKEQLKSSEKEKNWKFCPSCGEKIPEIERLKFCVNCGLNLEHIRKYKTLPPNYQEPPINYPGSPYAYKSYPQPYYYIRPSVPKLADDEILNTRGKKLWSTITSLLIPLGAFLLMNGLLLIIMFGLMFIVYDLDFLYSLIENDYFIIISTLIELILMLIPIIYVKKFLQRPDLKNRFELLGFTRKGFDSKGLAKEILIGAGFAVVGLIIVAFASIGIEIILEFFLQIEIIQESPVGDAELLVNSDNILSLILMVLVMMVIVGPAEEILFRGFMQKGLVRNLGDVWGLIITALIFALIHLVSLFFYIFDPFTFFILFLYLFVPYFAISITLGLLYRWRKENLIAVIIMHGLYNSLTVIIAFIYLLGP